MDPPAVPSAFKPLELGPQVVHEQRLDDFQDVLLGGVVRPLGPALVRVHDRLEQGPEDRRRDVRPVEGAGFQHQAPHGGVEGGDAQRPLEEPAVDEGEPQEVLVPRRNALALRRVEHLEQFGHECAQVGAVLARARLDEIAEHVPRVEDARVVGEETEDGPHEKPFEILPPVSD